MRRGRFASTPSTPEHDFEQISHIAGKDASRSGGERARQERR
jgi:hypothetical protein